MNVKVLMFSLHITLINVTKIVASEDLQKWEDFKIQYAKHYRTPEEEKKRLKIFKENLRKIANHNKQFKKGQKTFKIGVNMFADMTAEEFRTSFLPNSTISKYIKKISKSVRGKSIARQFTGYVPEYKNWIIEGAVTRVKHQSYHCGSCWAFAAADAIESHNFITTGKLVELSVQNLLDCVGETYVGGDVNSPDSWSNNDCKGGFPAEAFKYVINNGGIDTEESYPYTARQEQCCYRAKYIGANIRDMRYVEPYDEEELKRIVGLIGPVACVLSTDNDWQYYRFDSGIYKNSECGKYPSKFNLNHVALVVGYGTEGNVPYWLVKNSWGHEWGLGGYIKILRGSLICDISAISMYPVV